MKKNKKINIIKKNINTSNKKLKIKNSRMKNSMVKIIEKNINISIKKLKIKTFNFLILL
jgi:hypothetical protein